MIDGRPVEALHFIIRMRPAMTVNQRTHYLNQPVPDIPLTHTLIPSTIHNQIQQTSLVAKFHVEAGPPRSFVNEMVIHPRNVRVVSNLPQQRNLPMGFLPLHILAPKRFLDEDAIERVVLKARGSDPSVEAAAQGPETLDGEPLEFGSLKVCDSGFEIVCGRYSGGFLG